MWGASGMGMEGEGVTTADGQAHHGLVSVSDAHRLFARHCGVRGAVCSGPLSALAATVLAVELINSGRQV